MSSQEQQEIYATLLRAMNTNLVLMANTMDLDLHPPSSKSDPFCAGDWHASSAPGLVDELALLSMPVYAAKLNEARILCQCNVERLQQKLLNYHTGQAELNPSVGAHSPLLLVRELGDTVRSLVCDRLSVDILLDDTVPERWHFDRKLVEMAMLYAIHKAIAHARSAIRIEADVRDGYLALIVHDDSEGNPEQIHVHGSEIGLGLRFASLIAELHRNHGRMGIVQQYRLYNDVGSIFCMLLP